MRRTASRTQVPASHTAQGTPAAGMLACTRETNARSSVRTATRAHIRTHSRTQPRARARAHTYTYTYTYAHTYTRRHKLGVHARTMPQGARSHSGSYWNEADFEDPHFQESHWGKATYARLLALKTLHDPTGLFYGPSAASRSSSFATFARVGCLGCLEGSTCLG